MAGDTAHALRNLILHGAVRDVGVGLVRHPLAEAGSHEPFRDGGAQRHGMTLSERAGSVLDTAREVCFRVTRRHAAPLTQRLKVFGRIVPGKRKRRIEHRRHVARIEEETITVGVRRIVRIVPQKFGIEHRHEVGAAHGAAGVSRFRLLDHGGRQNADIVRYTR